MAQSCGVAFVAAITRAFSQLLWYKTVRSQSLSEWLKIHINIYYLAFFPNFIIFWDCTVPRDQIDEIIAKIALLHHLSTWCMLVQ